MECAHKHIVTSCLEINIPEAVRSIGICLGLCAKQLHDKVVNLYILEPIHDVCVV